jgi:hypothetical protein
MIALLLTAGYELLYRIQSSPPTLGLAWLVLPWVVLGVVAPLGLLLALVETGFWLLARRVCWSASPSLTESGDTDSRFVTPVSLHASASQGVLGVLVLLAGSFACAEQLDRIQDDAFRHYMLLYVVAVAAAAGAIVAALSRRPLVLAWKAIDARFGLPWPKSRAVRLAILCLPPWLAMNALLNRYGDVLGVALVPTLLLAVAFAQVPLALLFAGLRAPRVKATYAVALAAFFTAPLFLDYSAPLARALGRQLVVGATLDTLRQLTDLDRDRVSGTYGAGDCDSLDGNIFPGQRDEPGNARDENCDGRDSGRVEPLQTFSDSLRPEQIRHYNILWILIDTMRVDRMSLYGARRKTTPFLEKLGRSSLVFEAAYAQGTTTHLSVPSAFAGRDVGASQWRYGKSPSRVELEQNVPTIAAVLSKSGYDSHAVVGDHVYRFPSMTRGFAKVVNAASRRGAVQTNKLAARFLEKRRPESKPFFLLAYYGDPHKPYGAPKNPFGESELDRYDAELLHVDRHLEKLIGGLQAKPEIWNETIVVVSSDHGEEFGEHGRTGHGTNCHEETMHVPLILRVPGLEERRIDSTVALVDIVPTLLELTGARESRLEPTGQSLLVPANGASEEGRLVTCVATKQGKSRGRAFYRSGVRRAGLFVQSERVSGVVEVFDTSEDAEERQDIWSKRVDAPEVAEALDFLNSRETGNLWQLRLP